MLDELLKTCEGCKFQLKPNFMKVTVTHLSPNEVNADVFNNILKACREEVPFSIVRTKSGGISYKTSNMNLPMFDYRVEKYGAEITIIGWRGYMYRIQFRALTKPEEAKKRISGHKAFLKLKSHLKKYEINIDDYAIKNGKEINAETERYLIYAPQEVWGKTIENAHHLDYHSSFPAGLVNTHPEFHDAINALYLKRKSSPICKAILNFAIGFFHTPLNGYKYAQLSKDAINDNNRRIREMITKLISSGRTILAINTDGVWYSGEVYHDQDEGPNLGQWANDHVNCTWRCKSAGCYEYIENDQYTPVMRGRCNLDLIEPDRSKWQWGDIFKVTPVLFKVTSEGIAYGTSI